MGSQIAKLTGPTDSLEWVSWHPGIPALLGGDRAGMMWLWNAQTAKCAKVYSGHQGPVTCGGFKSDGSIIWSASEDTSLRIWSPRTAQTTTTLHGVTFHHEPIINGCCSPNGMLLATGDISGIVKVVRFEDGKILGQLDTGANTIEAVWFSPDNNWIAIASMGGAVTVWSCVNLKIRHAMSHPEGVPA